MVEQPAFADLPLVARELAPAADELRDVGPDSPLLGEAPGMARAPRCSMEAAFEAGGHGRRSYRWAVASPLQDARILHLPVNLAGTGWSHVNALRRKGVDARLLVFWPQKWRPDEYDINLNLPRKGLLRQQAVLWPALARYLPQTDIFHFYFGKTLVPKRLNMPILKAARKRSVMHFLGADIRGKPPEELEYRKKFDAWIVGSYAATRWVPDAIVIPPGLDLRDYEPVPPVERERPLVVHAPSDPEK